MECGNFSLKYVFFVHKSNQDNNENYADDDDFLLDKKGKISFEIK